MMTTQNNTEVKDAFRAGYLADANGNTFAFQLWMSDRKTHIAVQLDIYRSQAVEANRVGGETYTALSMDSARTAWKRMWTKLAGEYTVVSHKTHTVTRDHKESTTEFQAKPEGGIRKLIAEFWDGNEGRYTLEADFVTMVMRSGGTACPDIPMEYTDFPVAGGAVALDAVFQKAVKAHTKRYIPSGVVCVAMNWIRTVWEADKVRA